MKNKNQKSRIRAIKSTTLIPDLASYVSEQCARYCEASRLIGLFPYQEYYRGLRLFAVYHQHYFLEAFRSFSSAKRFVKSHIDPSYSKDLHIVLFEAK